MAHATVSLISALHKTALRLENGAQYRWSHFGQCNCGQLAQTITALAPQALYGAAFARAGDWGEQARDFCPTSGLPMDTIFDRLFEIGMVPDDVRHLERLSDDAVLRAFPGETLRHNVREDVVRYMRAWALLLQEQLPAVELALAAE